ncbi:hypothetical protein IGI04_012006 [Brassica rapa subsp. trilocularis]|uniref:Uncharacterized protein n=1 Tax=Brassica rapa subsp. trilocularis TaxID=1813537 RepID=A0ABQ7N4Q4_BRACM|nr:hypothetical protein IGI04_012006 [Brassica rapa subsp. trilocularis]
MEEELVNCYLKRKINGQEIELAIIPRDEATKERVGAHAPIILSEVNVFDSCALCKVFKKNGICTEQETEQQLQILKAICIVYCQINPHRDIIQEIENRSTFQKKKGNGMKLDL